MSVEVFHATPPARPYRFELLPEDAMASALELLDQPLDDDVSEELDGTVQQGLERALAFADVQAAEQRSALILLSGLSSLDLDGGRQRLGSHRPRFRSTELCRLLFDKCAEEAHRDPAQARKFSELGLLAAELIDLGDLPRPIRHDVRAETWAAVADTRRLTFDLAGAETAFAEAERHLRSGSGTLMVRAELLIRKASLSCDLEQFERGLRAVDQALCILRAGAMGAEIARALLAKGRLKLASGLPETALPHFEDALELLEDSTDRTLILAAQQNLAACLCELERFTEARRPFQVALSTAKLLARPLGVLQLRWLQGRLAQGEGQPDVAEAAYGDAMEGFLARGLETLAARVGLDLARLYVHQRRLVRMRRLVRPLLPILRDRKEAWRRRPVADRSW